MENLREYIVRSHAGRRPISRRPERDEADEIGITSANGLHTASAFFLANTAPKEREARMQTFWRKMAKYRNRDMIVVALAVGKDGA